jgi:hypothetical protein
LAITVGKTVERKWGKSNIQREVISDGSINAGWMVGERKGRGRGNVCTCYKRSVTSSQHIKNKISTAVLVPYIAVGYSSGLASLPNLYLFSLAVSTSRCVALWTLIYHDVNPRTAACALLWRY